MDCSLPGSSVHGPLQARILEWVPFCKRSSQPRDQIQVSRIAGILYHLSHQVSLRIVGSQSFLRLIFLTQKSNQGLLHCRWILYQLIYMYLIPIYEYIGMEQTFDYSITLQVISLRTINHFSAGYEKYKSKQQEWGPQYMVIFPNQNQSN